MPNPEQAELRQEYIDRIQDAIIAQEFVETGKSRREAMLKRLLGDGKVKRAELDRLVERSPPVSDRKSFDALYGKPLSPDTKRLAGWGSRAGGILAQMLDDLPGDGALSALAPRLAGPVRTGSVLAGRLTVFAMPGGYRRMFAERVLFLVLLAGALLVGVSWFVQEPAPARFGFTIVGLATALWVLLYVVGRVLRDQSPLPTVARGVLVAVCLLLIAVGAWTTYDLGTRLIGPYLDREDVVSSG